MSLGNKNELPTTIQAIIFDFDGVFTDNRVLVDEDGKESVICNRSDGLGVSVIKKSVFPSLFCRKKKILLFGEDARKWGYLVLMGLIIKKHILYHG